MEGVVAVSLTPDHVHTDNRRKTDAPSTVGKQAPSFLTAILAAHL